MIRNFSCSSTVHCFLSMLMSPCLLIVGTVSRWGSRPSSPDFSFLHHCRFECISLHYIQMFNDSGAHSLIMLWSCSVELRILHDAFRSITTHLCWGEGVQFCLYLKILTNCLSNKYVLRVKSCWRCLGSLWRCWAFMGVFGVFSDFLLVLSVWSELLSCTPSSLWSFIIQSPLQVSRLCSLL